MSSILWKCWEGQGVEELGSAGVLIYFKRIFFLPPASGSPVYTGLKSPLHYSSLYKNGCGSVYRTPAFVRPASRYSWSPLLTLNSSNAPECLPGPTLIWGIFPPASRLRRLKRACWACVNSDAHALCSGQVYCSANSGFYYSSPASQPSASFSSLSHPQPRGPPYSPPLFFSHTPLHPRLGNLHWRSGDAAVLPLRGVGGWGVVPGAAQVTPPLPPYWRSWVRGGSPRKPGGGQSTNDSRGGGSGEHKLSGALREVAQSFLVYGEQLPAAAILLSQPLRAPCR